MFKNWLLDKLKEKDWTQADLARATSLTTGAVSNYINGRIPDEAALRKIAKALKLPAETVFRAAGILPPALPSNPLVDEVTFLAAKLPQQDVQDLIDLARSKLQRYERIENAGRKA